MNFMVKIEIDVPDDLERLAKSLNVKLSILVASALREQLEKIARIEAIAAKSQATEEDVEELTNEINTAMWNNHKR